LQALIRRQGKRCASSRRSPAASVEEKLSRAAAAFRAHRLTTFNERAAKMRRVG
jgi:hypothetical protein